MELLSVTRSSKFFREENHTPFAALFHKRSTASQVLDFKGRLLSSPKETSSLNP